MKVVRTTVKTTVATTAKTPYSTMPKTTGKKLHRGTKANRCRQNHRRFQTTKMKMTTEPVPRTSMATVTEEVILIPVPEEGPRNG